MRFFDYLLTIETLAEGKGNAYLGMFNDFITDNAEAKQSIEKYINWARKNLQKNDRVVWFLRWVRVELAGRAKHTDSDAELERLNKRLCVQNFSRHDLVPINNLMTNLTHLLGMPIPQMQAIVWQKQSPRELLEQLGNIESDWKEANQSSNNLLNYHEDAEPTVVMSFPDGYRWFDLERSTCSAEARAMGHCGNAGGGGTILSLRRLAKSHEGRTYWYPVLTFILHSDGYLGEMKGRNNDKPIEKYHPYIIALLKNYSEIEGIRGGGYLPEHNFAMSDLDPDVAKELKELKPGLADLDDIYRAEGMTPRLIQLVDSRLPSGLSTGRYDKDAKVFIVEEWKDFESFLSGIYDEDVEKILEIAQGEADFQVDRTGNEPEAFVETVLEMPPHWQERLITRVGMNKPPGSSMDQVVMDAAHQMVQDDDDWYQKFLAVYVSEDRIKDEAWERLSLYVKAGWSFVCMSVYLNIPDDEEELKAFVANNTPVRLRMHDGDIINYAMANADEDGDDETAWELRQMQGDSYGNASWDTIDDENTNERRREEGLYSSNYGSSNYARERNKDQWLAGVDTDTKSLTADFLAVLQGNPIPGRIHDERQNELNFKAESAKLSRLLQLSGL